VLAPVEGVGASWKRCPKNPYADHVTGRHPADKEPNRAERDLSSATPNRVKPPERFGARGAPGWLAPAGAFILTKPLARLDWAASLHPIRMTRTEGARPR
jgi:hypothetical protein